MIIINDVKIETLNNFASFINNKFMSLILPIENELPSSFADRVGLQYSSNISQVVKRNKGQFFTPLSISRFMSKLAKKTAHTISILDPGCGVAILSCCLIEHLVKTYDINNIHLDTYEVDTILLPFTEKVLDYLCEWLNKQNIVFSYSISKEDFVLENAYVLCDNELLFNSKTSVKYDFVISNPPYFKLAKDDPKTVAALPLINGQPNIYSIFMAISAKLLKPDGEMIFITPRSFASGRYFRKFREYLFSIVDVKFVHLFNTRKYTFTNDNVLQETIITKCTTKKDIDNHTVTISYSEGVIDLDRSSSKEYHEKDIIDKESAEKILYLPVSKREDLIFKLFQSWNGSLNKYGLQISTGPVVAFRTRDSISNVKTSDSVPLYWLHNVVKMLCDHPVLKSGKPQYIKIDEKSTPLLLQNKDYILLRRFSSKDDQSRLIAAPYFGNISSYKYIGFENKLNYIYRPKGHLLREEVMGIAALLNSDIFDSYFRIFNGNVNVSATELRAMPFPDLEVIKAIGKELIFINDFSINNTNMIVNKFFDL